MLGMGKCSTFTGQSLKNGPPCCAPQSTAKWPSCTHTCSWGCSLCLHSFWSLRELTVAVGKWFPFLLLHLPRTQMTELRFSLVFLVWVGIFWETGFGTLGSNHQVSFQTSNGRATCFPRGSVVKKPPANAEDVGSIPGSRRSPWSGKWQLTPVFLPEKFHGQRSPAGYSPWGPKELDTTEADHTQTQQESQGQRGGEKP